MKTKTRLFTYLAFVLFLGFAMSSCEGPEGPVGPQGAQGDQGAAGTDGATGANGANGTNCWDLNGDGVQDAAEDVNGDGVWNAADCAGADGADGADGTANANVYIFNNPTWDAGSNMILNLSAITQEVMDSYVVQAYLGFPVDNVPNSVYYNVPGAANAGAYYFRSWMNVGTYTIKAVEADNYENTYPNPDVASSAKIILIAPANTTSTDGNGRFGDPKEAIYNELAAAGVDITNYFEVCAYYGINP